MSQAAQTAELLALARSREPEDRERLLAGIVDLCETGEAQGKPAAPEIQVLLDSIFMTLVVEAEREIRQRLAERLADAAWAPSALVNILALDEIEIAQVLIEHADMISDWAGSAATPWRASIIGCRVRRDSRRPWQIVGRRCGTCVRTPRNLG